MSGFRFLFLVVIGALLCAPHTAEPTFGLGKNESGQGSTQPPTDETSGFSNTPEASTPMSSEAAPAVTPSSTRPTTSASSDATPSTPASNIWFSKDCLPALMVTGGLIIACTILLISTMLLACKVCVLSKRIKALSSNADLISNTEYWTGTGQQKKSKSGDEPKETCVLMADVNQTQEEMGNGATAKEEGGVVNKDGPKGEDGGDVGKSVEASTPPDAAEISSSAKQSQEEVADSQPAKAVAAPTSEGAEEAKDVA